MSGVPGVPKGPESGPPREPRSLRSFLPVLLAAAFGSFTLAFIGAVTAAQAFAALLAVVLLALPAGGWVDLSLSPGFRGALHRWDPPLRAWEAGALGLSLGGVLWLQSLSSVADRGSSLLLAALAAVLAWEGLSAEASGHPRLPALLAWFGVLAVPVRLAGLAGGRPPMPQEALFAVVMGVSLCYVLRVLLSRPWRTPSPEPSSEPTESPGPPEE